MPGPAIIVCFDSNGLSREMVVPFVDIGEIYDHHCLNFLFIADICSSDSGLQSKLHITEAVLFVMGIELNTIILNGLR